MADKRDVKDGSIRNILFTTELEYDYSSISSSFTSINTLDETKYSLIKIINDTDADLSFSFGEPNDASASDTHLTIPAGISDYLDLDANTMFFRKSIWVKDKGAAPTSGKVYIMRGE